MSKDFISSFIDDCVQKGKASPEEILQLALEETQELDQKIQELEALRARQNNLKMVIKRMGGEQPKKNKAKAPTSLVLSSLELDDYTKDICVKICDLVEEQAQITPRQAMDATVSLANNTHAYVAIKWLQDHGVLRRSIDSLSLVKGKNWNNRPIKEGDA